MQTIYSIVGQVPVAVIGDAEAELVKCLTLTGDSFVKVDGGNLVVYIAEEGLAEGVAEQMTLAICDFCSKYATACSLFTTETGYLNVGPGSGGADANTNAHVQKMLATLNALAAIDVERRQMFELVPA